MASLYKYLAKQQHLFNEGPSQEGPNDCLHQDLNTSIEHFLHHLLHTCVLGQELIVQKLHC